MITISKPKPEDAEGINETIKKSWHATYITSEIGMTKKDINLMYAENEKKQIEVFRHRAENPKNKVIPQLWKQSCPRFGVFVITS